MDTDSDSDPVYRPNSGIEEEEDVSDTEVDLNDTDQALSEEQTYRETVRGVRAFMGWTHVPDVDTSSVQMTTHAQSLSSNQ